MRTTTIPRQPGFTLIETLITTVVLVTGLAAVAGLFSQSMETNFRNRQRAAAEALLTSKMEELRRSGAQPGGPTAEYLDVSAEGEAISQDSAHAPFLRTTVVTAESPRRITVVVYCRRNERGGAYRELTRGTMLLAAGF